MGAWDNLSVKEKADIMKVAISNGITNLSDIKQRYNAFAEGGDIEPEKYYAIMEKVAEENNAEWNRDRVEEGERPLTVDEDLVRILNDNDYDYRGYYNKYPNGDGNAIDHWTDEFKTAYHPTFSDQSIYSGKKSQFNPYGLPGGFWAGDSFVPRAWQVDESNKFEKGGIYIKPSHRGRLTELKARTGKTEAELYNDGNPAHKKMVVFARKWHDLGGNLFDIGGPKNSSTKTTGITKHVPIINPLLLVNKIRNRAYKAVSPYSNYSIPGNISNFLSGEDWVSDMDIQKGYDGKYYTDAFEGTVSPVEVVDDIWANYLGIPESQRRFKTRLEKSAYKPGMKGNPNSTYFKLPLKDYDIDRLVEETDDLSVGENVVSEDFARFNLGEHTIGRGFDDNGEYRSYYDR